MKKLIAILVIGACVSIIAVVCIRKTRPSEAELKKPDNDETFAVQVLSKTLLLDKSPEAVVLSGMSAQLVRNMDGEEMARKTILSIRAVLAEHPLTEWVFKKELKEGGQGTFVTWKWDNLRIFLEYSDAGDPINLGKRAW